MFHLPLAGWFSDAESPLWRCARQPCAEPVRVPGLGLRVSPGGLWEDLWPRFQKGRSVRRPGPRACPRGTVRGHVGLPKGASTSLKMRSCDPLIVCQAACRACPLAWGPRGTLVLEQRL